MKHIHLSLLLLAGLSTLSIVGCGSVPPTYYYRVDYNIDSTDHAASTVPFTLGVAQFNADALYESDRIVYRESPYQAQFYHYRRWVAAPKKIVTEKVLKHYQQADAFKGVVRIPSPLKIDYVLRGDIYSFEEWDEDGKWYGVVSIAFALHDSETAETVWEKTLTERTQAEKKEPVAVVKAISESLNKVVEQSIVQITNHLRTASSN